jgi:hypothetical protein
VHWLSQIFIVIDPRLYRKYETGLTKNKFLKGVIFLMHVDVVFPTTNSPQSTTDLPQKNHELRTQLLKTPLKNKGIRTQKQLTCHKI